MPSNRRKSSRRAAAGSAPVDQETARQQRERRNQRRILIGVVGGLVLLVVATLGGIQLWRTYRSPQVPQATQPSATPATPREGKPVRFGESDAPVTMSLFEDFRCPHCQDFESEVGRTISGLVRSGRLQVRIYPLTFVEPDGASASTANAFACSVVAGFGPAYRAGLFANDKLAWTDDQLIGLAREIDAGRARSAGFAGCVRDGKKHGWLDSIAEAAERKKVRETPTVFINGHRRADAAEWSASKLRDEVQAAE